MIESIYPIDWQETRGIFSPAKKIDMGHTYLIYTCGIQADKNTKGEVISLDIAEQTENVFKTLENILSAAGATMDDVVKAQIFLTDMDEFVYVSPIRDRWFRNSKPVSTLVEVSGMTRKGARIEIELTAVVSK